MRPSTALCAKLAPLPKKITAHSLIRRLPEKKFTKRTPIREQLKQTRAREYPKDDIGDLSREANPLGSHIYFYTNIATKRVIYSLYQTLNNTKALKQITFMGKKSVPATLRKDMWTPFLTATFTNSATGLKAFQHLRELRRLHETQWDKELLTKPVRERSKILQDQRANSIADLAAICKRDVKGKEQVRVRWMNIYDAEYAAEWPSSVTHGLETQQYLRFSARRVGKFEPLPSRAPVVEAESGKPVKQSGAKAKAKAGVEDKAQVAEILPPAAEEEKKPKTGLWRW
ncbi:hypothetical protein DRE_02286 [Drechslerella stenobrocha 248]|uniref:Large ribosomal subunit protein mL67 n=1 Tax=Drechslerella stenobrocha 248 TaxID=1043628 RepID=W7I7V4_9PEZI|nr:hypothetical protein DRE_02286 [Drechslerella stenobrocha 248]